MKPFRIAFSMSVFFLGASLVLPARADAQLDHLFCYKVSKDDVKFTAATPTLVDLLADMQPDFTQAGCRIIRPVEFCVPATKVPHTTPPVTFNGQALQNDFVCYLAECPKAKPHTRVVRDQFGRRLQRQTIPFKVCVPARKAALPCGPTTSARQCGGTCDDPAQVCHFDKTAIPPCTCGGPPQGCENSKPDAAGQCGGTCPPGEACVSIVTGTTAVCHCGPPPPPPCEGSDPNAAGVCGGSCLNPNDQCVFSSATGKCTCQPVEQTCVPGSAPGQCTGTCVTNPNFVCALDPLTNQCRCAPPPQNCGPNTTTGQCGGICAAGSTCKFVPSTGTPGGTCQCL